MNKFTTLLSAGLLAANVSYAEFNRESLEKATGLSLGYNASWTSHYVWRGEDQSSKDMSPSIGADLGHSSGLYAGVWAGSISSFSGAEFDAYFGYAFDFGPLSIDIGDLYYLYPGETDETQFNEYYLSVGTEIPIGGFSISPYIYLAYAPKWYGPNTPDVFYSEFGVEVPIPDSPISISYTFGNIDTDDLDGDAEKANDIDSWHYHYLTFGFGEVLGLDASVTFHTAPGYKADAGSDGAFVTLGHEW